MKLAVHPDGATMHPLALTPRVWKPGQSVFRYSAAAGTWTPSAPAAWICARRSSVSQAGAGLLSVVVSAATAVGAASAQQHSARTADSVLERNVHLSSRRPEERRVGK